MLVIISVLVFIFVGLVLALFGGGGGMILIPYLREALGIPVDQAALLSLITIGANSGVLTIHDRRAVAWKPVVLFSLVSLPVATLSGKYLAPITPDSLRMVLLGVVTLCVAFKMLFQTDTSKDPPTINGIAVGFAAIATGIICDGRRRRARARRGIIGRRR